MKSSAVPATLFCTALMLAPLCGVAGSAKATTAIAQQTGIVKGTVVDANGEAVIGASVIIEGQKVTQGTVTDFDGNFSLNVKPGAKLKISYIGFVSQTVVAKNGMQVVLKEEATSLKAVEVVAYGVQKKVTVTGALSSVKSEDLVHLLLVMSTMCSVVSFRVLPPYSIPVSRVQMLRTYLFVVRHLSMVPTLWFRWMVWSEA